MRVNCSINNSSIHLDDVNLDFSQYGIYVLTGTNGTGKSTLLKTIAFEHVDVQFHNQKQEEQYKHNRHQLITYIEQEPAIYDGRVREYLTRYQSNLDTELLEDLLVKFHLNQIDVKTKVEDLSGGELVKLNIIAGLLKKTPYIFMDEPTNNMDNDSVCEFMNVLNQLKNDHTIVLVTHDPRLKDLEANELVIEQDQVIVTKTQQNRLNETIGPNISFPRKNLILGFLKNNYVLLHTLMMVVIVTIILYSNSVIYNSWYSEEELPNKSNIVVSYLLNMQYGRLNQEYVEGAGLHINESDYNKLHTFEDLQGISSFEGTNQILFSDDEYLDELGKAASENQLLEKMYIVSIPNDLIESFGNVINYCIDIRYMDQGRLPSDHCKEVAISADLLQKFYGYTDKQVSSAIGNIIKVGQDDYKIVGIASNDLCILSFSGNGGYGFWLYNSKNSNDIITNLEHYLYGINENIYNVPSYVTVYTKEGYETDVLNKLITTYPANNYVSYEFAKTYLDHFNTRTTIYMLLDNGIAALVIGILIWFLLRNELLLLSDNIQSIDYYYLSLGKTKKIYFHCRVLQYMVIWCILIGCGIAIYGLRRVVMLVCILDILIMGLGFIMTYGRRKHATRD